jgi:translation elongation factor EF-G
MERVRQELEAFEERIAQKFNVDEKSVRALVKAFVGQEFARLHGIVMEEIARVRAEFEERLSRLGIDAEAIRRIVDEVYGRLLNDVKQLLDQRIMHVLDTINEQSSSIRDVLDLVNEILKAEAAFEEELARFRAEVRKYLNEEYLEELLYRALIRRGVIRQRRRRWAPLIAGLGVLAAVIAGFIINPIATLVILFITFAILMRW